MVKTKASVYHVQVNVGDARVSLPFYKDLLGYLEYRLLHEAPHLAGFSDGATAIWLVETDQRHAGAGFHRKRTGINHLALRVERREEVDRFREEFMRPRGIAALYGTPRDFPEYSEGYYAVFFEDPDRIKLELAHVPARARS